MFFLEFDYFVIERVYRILPINKLDLLYISFHEFKEGFLKNHERIAKWRSWHDICDTFYKSHSKYLFHKRIT